jgi:hypothetical protein
VGGGLHLGRRHGGGGSSDALAATQLLEEDDDLLCLFEAVRGWLGSRRLPSWAISAGFGLVSHFSLFFCFDSFFHFLFSNLNSI